MEASCNAASASNHTGILAIHDVEFGEHAFILNCSITSGTLVIQYKHWTKEVLTLVG